jgi:hypothetical protein
MNACLTSDSRLAAAVAKAQKVKDKKCGTIPDYGFFDAATARAAAIAQ